MDRKDFHMIEANKDIVLHCSDWRGEYRVEGRIMLKPNGRGKIVRKFCRLENDKWLSDNGNWQQRKSWSYK